MVGPVSGSDASQPQEGQTAQQKSQAFQLQFEMAVLGSYGAATQKNNSINPQIEGLKGDLQKGASVQDVATSLNQISTQLPGGKPLSMESSESVTEKDSLDRAAHRIINLFEQLNAEQSMTDSGVQHIKREAQGFINGNDPTAFNHLITTANSYLPSNAQLPLRS